jgi:hypothetical protein
MVAQNSSIHQNIPTESSVMELTGVAMPKPSESLIWLEDAGSARELTEAEKRYVDTEFSPFDGARVDQTSICSPI